MEPERWQRIEHLYHAVLEREESQQSAFLNAACAGDDALRDEVESLLACGKQAEQFIEAPAIQLAVKALARDYSTPDKLDPLIDRRLGAYQILKCIGSGGMGAVYRAFRADDQYRKEVAIKLLHTDQHSSSVISRFKNERQILATLDHPNIARLYDGGTTQEGVPYIVMELVEGQPIDEYCDSRKLPTSDRLQLFSQVCSALMYAHQRLIVHRDIKPSNILVTADRTPKLLDFGIAKLLDTETAPVAMERTLTLQRALTPGYASPEQVKGEPITTASDVYSLGVVLYELLTGHSPYRVDSRTPHEVSQAVCEIEPEKPSVLVRQMKGTDKKGSIELATKNVSAVRDGSPDKLSKRLTGDLDNILLMALRKEPRRRYASVEQFAEDIRRHLVGLPVIAHKDSSAYRARKFITRHRLGVAAAVLLALSLVGGMITTLWQARVTKYERARADRRFNDVRALANSLMFDINDSIQNLAGSTPARKLLVTKALQYLDSLSQEAGGDPSLQKELAAAYEKVGDLQGDPGAANLGDTAGALASYRKAMIIREAIAARDGNSVDSQRDLARDYQKVSYGLAASGDYAASLNYAEKFFGIQQRLASVVPGPESQERLAGAYYQRAWCQTDLGDFDAALHGLQESVSLREAVIREGDLGPLTRVRVRLAGTYGLMALVLGHEGEFKQAIAVLAKGSEILEKLSESDSTNAMYREYLNESLYYTGFYLHARGEVAPALKKYSQALNGFEALSSADSSEMRSKTFIGYCYRQIGKIQVATHNPLEGLKNIRKALAIAEELYRRDPTEKSDKLIGLADGYAALGLAHSKFATQPKISESARLRHWKEAKAAYEKSLSIIQDTKRLGAISGLDDHALEPDRIAHELASCDAALAQFTPR